MNFEGLLRMIFRRTARKAVNRGLGKALGGTGRNGAGDDLTPAQRKQKQQARQTARRARQAAKLTRRLGKF